MVFDDGKSERITVADKSNTLSGQHAVTDYRVIASSPRGSFLLWSSDFFIKLASVENVVPAISGKF